MTIETWELEKIKPYGRNARKIPQAAIDKVALSLQTYGWRQPIVVDPAGVIVAGHTRLLAARQLEWTTAPVHVATDLTPEQLRQYRLMDNRSHQESAWDYGELTFELGKLLKPLPWETVADPFCGTGATILACENQGRVCHATEVQPETAAIALQRCAEAGLEPTLAASSRLESDSRSTQNHRVQAATVESQCETRSPV